MKTNKTRIHRIRTVLFAFFCLSLAGCSPSPGLEKTEQGYLITPGVGIENLSLNDSIQHARTHFSPHFVTKDGYLLLPSKGIDTAYDVNGKIKTIFLYYRLPEYTTFYGETDKGIGKDSSVEEVYAAYGVPTAESDSVISAFGALPGAQEHSMDYEHQGITFTFWDNRLADIRIFPSR